jgi:6-phosphogluconolactonase
MSSVRVLSDSRSLAAAAADMILREIEEVLGRRKRFSLVLSGGSTPGETYGFLASGRRRTRIDWSRVEFFWGDERCVPTEHPESNYALVWKSLLSKVPHLPDKVHRIEVEAGAEGAAERYDALIRGAGLGAGRAPRFDLVLLGMGADGHVASLFPGAPALEERERLAVAVRAPAEPVERVTLTLPAINAARHVLFLVQGTVKAEAAARALGPSGERKAAEELPAARVRPTSARLTWLLDTDAAAGLQL